ncbi:hypothetical protein CHU98_g1150 [Xylaria longipes]|nr:hypothetical protein CHU98_g1150 [Xylaria longipes]
MAGSQDEDSTTSNPGNPVSTNTPTTDQANPVEETPHAEASARDPSTFPYQWPFLPDPRMNPQYYFDGSNVTDWLDDLDTDVAFQTLPEAIRVTYLPSYCKTKQLRQLVKLHLRGETNWDKACKKLKAEFRYSDLKQNRSAVATLINYKNKPRVAGLHGLKLYFGQHRVLVEDIKKSNEVYDQQLFTRGLLKGLERDTINQIRVNLRKSLPVTPAAVATVPGPKGQVTIEGKPYTMEKRSKPTEVDELADRLSRLEINQSRAFLTKDVNAIMHWNGKWFLGGPLSPKTLTCIPLPSEVITRRRRGTGILVEGMKWIYKNVPGDDKSLRYRACYQLRKLNQFPDDPEMDEEYAKNKLGQETPSTREKEDPERPQASPATGANAIPIGPRIRVTRACDASARALFNSCGDEDFVDEDQKQDFVWTTSIDSNGLLVLQGYMPEDPNFTVSSLARNKAGAPFESIEPGNSQQTEAALQGRVRDVTMLDGESSTDRANTPTTPELFDREPTPTTRAGLEERRLERERLWSQKVAGLMDKKVDVTLKDLILGTPGYAEILIEGISRLGHAASVEETIRVFPRQLPSLPSDPTGGNGAQMSINSVFAEGFPNDYSDSGERDQNEIIVEDEDDNRTWARVAQERRHTRRTIIRVDPLYTKGFNYRLARQATSPGNTIRLPGSTSSQNPVLDVSTW